MTECHLPSRDQPEETGPAAPDLRGPSRLQQDSPCGQADHSRPKGLHPWQAPEVHHQAPQRDPGDHPPEPHLQRDADRVVPRWQCPQQNEGAAAVRKYPKWYYWLHFCEHIDSHLLDSSGGLILVTKPPVTMTNNSRLPNLPVPIDSAVYVSPLLRYIALPSKVSKLSWTKLFRIYSGI